MRLEHNQNVRLVDGAVEVESLVPFGAPNPLRNKIIAGELTGRTAVFFPDSKFIVVSQADGKRHTFMRASDIAVLIVDNDHA